MNVKNLFADDDAVSPVIGVILMVAITVILAAVIGAFVLNIGGSQDTTPSVAFDYEQAYGSDTIVTVQSAGETVPVGNWGINGNFDDSNLNTTDISKPALSSGEKFIVDNQDFDITWQSPSTDKTAILGSYSP